MIRNHSLQPVAGCGGGKGVTALGAQRHCDSGSRFSVSARRQMRGVGSSRRTTGVVCRVISADLGERPSIMVLVFARDTSQPGAGDAGVLRLEHHQRGGSDCLRSISRRLRLGAQTAALSVEKEAPFSKRRTPGCRLIGILECGEPVQGVLRR
jgi:hypothetical protein